MISSPHPPTDQAPQEDVIEWKRAHPAFMITGLLRNLRGFIFPLAIVLIGNLNRDSEVANLVFLGISAVVVLISGIASVIQWRFYRYALTPERLLVNSGIVFRQERAIPYQRIQTVDLEEAPLDRIFGVAQMKIETAAGGTGESEVQLRAVKRDEAEALRESLLRARSAARQEEPAGDVAAPEPADAGTAPAEPVVAGEVLRTLSTGDLLLAGATSATIGPAAAIIGVATQFADDLVPTDWWERVPWDAISGASNNLGLIAVLILIVAVFAWLLAIAGTVLTYYGFELRRDSDHLIVQYGLLDRRRTTIPIRRIQAVRVEEGLLRQPFRYAALRYDSAGRAGSEESGSGVLFPMLPRREVRALLEDAAPEFAVEVDQPSLERLPRRALPRYIVGDVIVSVIIIAIVMGTIWYWRDGLPWWGYLPLFGLPFEIIFGWLGWRDGGWTIDDRVLLLRTRGVARTTFVTPRRRIQHRRTTTNPLQRRAGLTTLHVSVASGGMGAHVSLAHLDAGVGKRLLLALKPGAKPAWA